MSTEKSNDEYTRTDVKIPSKSKGIRIAAWKYLPKTYVSGQKIPVVVGGNGITLQKSNGLDTYASHFAKLGYGSIMFDYRFWGESEGKPRYVVDIPSQHSDFKSVIEWSRNQSEFDAEKVILVGSSLGSGHATCIASKDHNLAGVIALNPYSSPVSTLMNVLSPTNLTLLPLGMLDWTLSLGSRISIFPPILVKPTHKYDLEKRKPKGRFQFSILNAGDTAERAAEVNKHATEGEPYPHKIAARILMTLPFYAPTLRSKKVQCPYLVVVSKGKDALAPTSAAIKMAKKAPKGEFQEIGDETSGHFAVYEGTTTGNAVEEACLKTGEFLKRTLSLNQDQ